MESSTTPTVDQISCMEFSGNITPNAWFDRLKMPSGSTDLVSIVLLGEIVYWYRQQEVRDEATGRTICFKKRFDADKLQRSARSLADKFGLSIKQVRESLSRLEKGGYITKELRTITTNSGMVLPNMLFIEPIPAAIEQLNVPPRREGGLSLDGRRSIPAGDGVYPSGGGYLSPQVQTITETTTKNTTKTSTREEQFRSPSYLINLPISDIEEFRVKFDISEIGITSTAESAYDWYMSNTRRNHRENWKSVLRNWLRSDTEKIRDRHGSNADGHSDAIDASEIEEIVDYVTKAEGLKPFASKDRQCKAAKQILQAGYTVNEAKQAIKRMAEDSYWRDKTFDTLALARHITRYSKDQTEGFIDLDAIRAEREARNG